LPLAEKTLVAGIRRRAGSRRGALLTGIGDDCAVLQIPRGHQALVTTDFSLEGIHFRREWHPADSVGHRCLARGLSDIAAMGGIPVAAFLSLALPRKLPQSWVDGFTKGLLRLASQYRVPLAGGDTAESPSGVLADIVVVGSVPDGKAILRSGAKPGDRIYVTGELGGSAATLDQLLSRRKVRIAEHPRHFHPQPRLEVGRVLREKNLASAMIDLSDGLSTDLSHVCEESGVGAEIHGAALPAAQLEGKPVPVRFVLHGGEDYELLFTASAGKNVPSRIAGIPVTEIGRIVRGKKVQLINAGRTRTELRPQGWQHFRK
jgi:thiamine-monophosphate kinase